MKEKDAKDDGEEAADGAQGAIGSHAQPLLEQDGRTGHDGRGEEHVVDRCDNRRVEDVQGFVQVADLDADAED